MNVLQPLIDGVCVGISTSIVWALLVWSINFLRFKQIERQIQKAISPSSLSVVADGSVGMKIENATLHKLTIREVKLIGGSNNSFNIQLGFNPNHSDKGIVADAHDWVELPPQTKGTWTFPFHQRLPGNFLSQIRPLKIIVVRVEYNSLLGGVRLIDVGPARNLKAADFEEFLDGNYHEKLFRSPTIGTAHDS